MAWQKGWRERTIDIQDMTLEDVVSKAKEILSQEEFLASLSDFMVSRRSGDYYDNSDIPILEYYTPPTQKERDDEEKYKRQRESSERLQYEALKKKFEGS